jgi:hypothetical protein
MLLLQSIVLILFVVGILFQTMKCHEREYRRVLRLALIRERHSKLSGAAAVFFSVVNGIISFDAATSWRKLLLLNEEVCDPEATTSWSG